MSTAAIDSAVSIRPVLHWCFRPEFLISLLGAAAIYHAFLAAATTQVHGDVYGTLFDDAMISMRYAQNLAEGHGLVWNPGERVEGYTNFLWTLIMAGLHLLPLQEGIVPLAVGILSAGVLLANGLVTARIAELAGGDRLVAGAAAVLTLTYYPLIYWSLRGLEVGFICLLIGLLLLVAFRLERQATTISVAFYAALIAALLLTRQDALIPVLIVSTHVAIWSPMGKRAALWGGAAIVGTSTLHTMFRIMYYGDILPNTFYLKLGGATIGERLVRGFGSLWDLMAGHLYLAPVIVCGAVLLCVRALPSKSSPESRRIALLGAIILGQLAYSVYVGGDAWEWMGFSNRYISVGFPALSVLIALSIVTVSKRVLDQLSIGSRKTSPLTICALAALWLQMNFDPVRQWIAHGATYVRDDLALVHTALRLRELTSSETRIAVVWAGTLPYFAHRYSIDLLGKMDPVIAKSSPRTAFWPGHNKWNWDHSLSVYRPDLVLQAMRLHETEAVATLARFGCRPANGLELGDYPSKLLYACDIRVNG